MLLFLFSFATQTSMEIGREFVDDTKVTTEGPV